MKWLNEARLFTITPNIRIMTGHKINHLVVNCSFRFSHRQWWIVIEATETCLRAKLFTSELTPHVSGI